MAVNAVASGITTTGNSLPCRVAAGTGGGRVCVPIGRGPGWGGGAVGELVVPEPVDGAACVFMGPDWGGGLLLGEEAAVDGDGGDVAARIATGGAGRWSGRGGPGPSADGRSGGWPPIFVRRVPGRPGRAVVLVAVFGVGDGQHCGDDGRPVGLVVGAGGEVARAKAGEQVGVGDLAGVRAQFAGRVGVGGGEGFGAFRVGAAGEVVRSGQVAGGHQADAVDAIHMHGAVERGVEDAGGTARPGPGQGSAGSAGPGVAGRRAEGSGHLRGRA